MNLDANILIVDDQAENLFLLSSILKKMGCSVQTFDDPTLISDHIQTIKYDLVILDILMPEIDGFELCEIIKKNKDYEHIPIIFISALDEEEMIVQAFRLGANDYITKPIKKEEVCIRVENQLLYKNKYNSLARILHFAFHDLLTPLNIISNDLYLLEQKFGETNNTKRIAIALQGLQSIYDDMLYSVKQEEIQNHSYSTKLLQALLEHIESMNLLAQNKNIEIQLAKKTEEFIVKVPKLAIDRLLINTLSNAIKYSPSKSVVTIDIEKVENCAIVSISNISQTSLDFTTFFHTGLKEHEKIQGVGIGLEIIRHICLEYQIKINTTRENGKITFNYSFPL